MQRFDRLAPNLIHDKWTEIDPLNRIGS